MHALLHDEAAQRYAPQLEAVALAHAPRPSQYEGGVTIPAAQLAAPHTVELPGTGPQASRSEPVHAA